MRFHCVNDLVVQRIWAVTHLSLEETLAIILINNLGDKKEWTNTGTSLSLDSLDKCAKCRSWIITNAVFILAIATYRPHFHFVTYCSRNLESIKRCLRMFCRPQESTRPGSLRNFLGSVAGVLCWRPSVNGRQVIVFLLRRLCACRWRKNTMVYREFWTTLRVCAVTTLLHSLFYGLDRQSQPNRRECQCWNLQDQPFAFCG